MDPYSEGLEHYRRGKYARALEHLEPLAGQDGLPGRLTRFYVGMCHRALGIGAMSREAFDEAARHLRRARGLIGREAELTSYLATLYARTNQPHACATQLQRLTDRADPPPDADRKLAQAQWRCGRHEEAYLTLAAALRRRGARGDLLMQLALFCAAEERFAEARRHLRAVVQLDCTNPHAHYYLGLCAAAQGDVRAAAESFQRAFDLCPTDLLVALQLATAARAVGETGQRLVLRLPEPGAGAPAQSQVRQLANYLVRESDYVEGFLALPPSAVDAELFEMLAGVLQVALSTHGDYADLHYDLARVFERLDDPHRARDHAEQAVRINPRYAQALVLLSILEARLGRVDQAVASARRAVDCGADWPDVHCRLGEWMIQCNQREPARQHLRRALQLRRQYARAQRALRSLAA